MTRLGCATRSAGAQRESNPTIHPLNGPTTDLFNPARHGYTHFSLAEAPKLQTSNTKHQKRSKHQAPNAREAPSSKLEARAAVWSLEPGISLVFGAWCLMFRFGISFDLGVWDIRHCGLFVPEC